MEAARFVRVVEVMRAMADGDRAGVFALYEEFGGAIAAVLRRHIRRMGPERVRPDEVDGLVIDACFELSACASAWNPAGGALPWNWAERRLANVVSRHIGVHTDELDDERVADAASTASAEATAVDGEEVEVLERLAVLDERCDLLAEALAKVATPRNRAVLLEVKVQSALGDPSPAETVGRRHDMRADNVRQAVKRTKDRLRRLAAEDARYAPLAGLALLA